MPQNDPAEWRAARLAWETSPEMTLSEVAERLNVAVPTVSIRAKRDLWVKADAVDLDRLDYSPMQMVEVAVRALIRAASQTKDLPTAVKAAGMLLDRTMGRVVTEAKPLMTPDASSGQLPAPDWLDQTKRLRYQAEQALESIEPPSPLN